MPTFRAFPDACPKCLPPWQCDSPHHSADHGPEEMRHCDGCGEDYNAFEESHEGHR